MATIKITETRLAAIPPPTDAAQAYVWDTDVRGFGVVIGRTGRRTFVVRSRVGGRLVKRTGGSSMTASPSRPAAGNPANR